MGMGAVPQPALVLSGCDSWFTPPHSPAPASFMPAVFLLRFACCNKVVMSTHHHHSHMQHFSAVAAHACCGPRSVDFAFSAQDPHRREVCPSACCIRYARAPLRDRIKFYPILFG